MISPNIHSCRTEREEKDRANIKVDRAQVMSGLLRGRRTAQAGSVTVEQSVREEIKRREATREVDPDDGTGDGVAPVPNEFEYHSDGAQ